MRISQAHAASSTTVTEAAEAPALIARRAQRLEPPAILGRSGGFVGITSGLVSASCAVLTGGMCGLGVALTNVAVGLYVGSAAAYLAGGAYKKGAWSAASAGLAYMSSSQEIARLVFGRGMAFQAYQRVKLWVNVGLYFRSLARG